MLSTQCLNLKQVLGKWERGGEDGYMSDLAEDIENEHETRKKKIEGDETRIIAYSFEISREFHSPLPYSAEKVVRRL